MLYIVVPLYQRLDSSSQAIGRWWRTPPCLWHAYLPPPSPLPRKFLPTIIIFRCNCYIALGKLSLFNDMKCFARPIFFHYLLKCYAI
ncbi:hypothetical protein NC651_039494 [Populus alba x Populus x berolinensis]|nr:hypothetical protein NC651_039494 [Populus alba x Populus x berolinensis]